MNRQAVERIASKPLLKFPHMHGTVMVAKGDEVLLHEGFSYFDAPLPTDKHAQYLIASITKTFTAVALLKALFDKHIQTGLPENDAITLKSAVLTDLRKPLVNFPSSQIWSAPPEWAEHVNLHNLLTHTSGITNYQQPLAFQPGERYAYSNAGYILIGQIIEGLTCQPIDSYFRQMLFEPAHMSDTFLPLTGNPKRLKSDPQYKALTLGFEKNHGIYQSVSEDLIFENLLTAGGIISTAYDLVKWNHSLYSGEIIPLFLLDLVTKPYVNKEANLFYDGFDHSDYGYGLDIIGQGNTKAYQHCGGTKGYQSKLSYDPHTHISVVNLSNISEESPSVFAFSNELRVLLRNADNNVP